MVLNSDALAVDKATAVKKKEKLESTRGRFFCVVNCIESCYSYKKAGGYTVSNFENRERIQSEYRNSRCIEDADKIKTGD